MTTVPEIRFTRSGTVDLAYQVIGEGPVDIVAMIGWVSHLEVLWELPEVSTFVERLSRMGRVALFDKRGMGLSDRPSGGITFEEQVPDVLAVMDAAGMDRAVVLGWADAAGIAIMVAAAHPERVSALVLGEFVPTAMSDDGFEWGPDPSALGMIADTLELGMWGQGTMLPVIAPSVAGDERIMSWFRRLERMSVTPSMAADLLRRIMTTDVRPLLDKVEAPALLIHRKDSPLFRAEGMQWTADHMQRATYVEVPGDQTPGYLGDVDALMDEVEEFLIGTRVGAAVDRRVATVLFSDVVGSTEKVADVGDKAWSRLLETHRGEARRLLTRYGGTEINTAGDGFLITFDSPTPAIQCALALCESSRAAGLDVRVGLHTGEVVYESGDIVGMAVHIGARVSALAAPAEVWVSQTVRDMVIGSGFEFSSRGSHELKGVPGTWELYRVEGSP